MSEANIIYVSKIRLFRGLYHTMRFSRCRHLTALKGYIIPHYFVSFKTKFAHIHGNQNV